MGHIDNDCSHEGFKTRAASLYTNLLSDVIVASTSIESVSSRKETDMCVAVATLNGDVTSALDDDIVAFVDASAVASKQLACPIILLRVSFSCTVAGTARSRCFYEVCFEFHRALIP